MKFYSAECAEMDRAVILPAFRTLSWLLFPTARRAGPKHAVSWRS